MSEEGVLYVKLKYQKKLKISTNKERILKSLVNFNEFSFKITSASTCNFKKDDFVYI